METVLTFCLILFVGAIGMAIYNKNKIKSSRENSANVFNNLTDFKPTDMVLSGISMAYDADSQKICLLTSNKIPVIYNYADVIQSELIIDNETISRQSTTSTIGRAVLGGLLAGGVGAIVGGASTSRSQKVAAKSIDLKITINDTKYPIWKINFLNGLVKRDSPTFKSVMNSAEKWQALLTVMIKKGENAGVSTTTSGPASTEILKLKELLDQGVLNDTEFALAKQKLFS